MKEVSVVVDLDSLRTIQTLAATELHDRLRDQPESFSNAEIIRVYTELGKLDVLIARKTKDDRPRTINVFNIIDGLPDERKVQVLVEAYRQMGPERAKELGIDTALVNLVGEVRSKQLLALPPPEVVDGEASEEEETQ